MIATKDAIGINHFGKSALSDTVRTLARLGYSAIDFSAAAGKLAEDPEVLGSIRALTRECGLVPAATHFRSFGFNFLLPGERYEAFRRDSIADVRAAAFLGARAIAFHLGNDLAAKPSVSGSQLAEANAEAMRPAVLVAESEGIFVALENHCHGWGDRWEHLEAVARMLASPAVGFTLDTGHAVVAGQDPAAMARAMGDRLVLTHLHDNDGTADQHRPARCKGPNGDTPGGVIDWPALLAALRDTGYPQRHPWILEGGTQLAGDIVEQLLERHLAQFQRLLRAGG